MPDLKIAKGLWDDLVTVARKQKRKPESIVKDALQDYLRRLDDEELLERSYAAGRRAPFTIDESEELVRRGRRLRKS